MSVVTEPPRESFRIEMLWTDSRYRSTFLQIIAFCLLMLAVGWVINNTIQNLEALGKTFNFDFLFQTSAYDINQKLIPYSSESTHLRAAIVGVLNTLLVAFMGCITCTVIGVIVGVLRLSKNWLVRKITLVYVELLRNTPVLLQILLWYAVFIETLPVPRAYREGADGSADATMWFDAIAPTNRGFFIPRPIFEDGSVFFVAAFVLGVVAAILFGRWARARQEATGEILPTFWIKLALVALPPVIVYYLTGQPMRWAYPELQGFNFAAGEGEAIHMRNSLVALWLALSIYTSAFVAEIVRGGILAVAKGQTEAAAALGLRPNRIMSLVILPQALRIIIPPQISQYLNLTKNSSLAIAVGYMDVTGTLGGITLNQTGREMECILLLMAFYLTISLSISAVINWYNDRVKLKER
jgi:general L-amino acid transport system permease protein